MILAAPLVIPFAQAVGLSVGTLGMAALADKVNDYIQANPEESMKILSTIIPNVGIGQIFMSKEDKKFNLKGLLIVIIVVNIFLAVAAYFIDLIY